MLSLVSCVTGAGGACGWAALASAGSTDAVAGTVVAAGVAGVAGLLAVAGASLAVAWCARERREASTAGESPAELSGCARWLATTGS